jgi:hypothetical protein
LVALATPLSWGRGLSAAPPTPPEAEAAMAMADEAPCPLHRAAHQAAHQATHPSAPAQARTATHLPAGDCAACHVVALPPTVLTLLGPEPAHTAPLWSPALTQGRLRACELYRPPQA